MSEQLSHSANRYDAVIEAFDGLREELAPALSSRALGAFDTLAQLLRETKENYGQLEAGYRHLAEEYRQLEETRRQMIDDVEALEERLNLQWIEDMGF